MSFNLACMLTEGAASNPDKPAVILDQHRLSYRELDEASNRFAAGLWKSGINPGDRVAMMLPNIPQFLIAYFGILKAGAAMVPMNVLLKAPEIAHYLKDSGAVAFLVWDGVAAEGWKGAEQGGKVTTYVVATGMGETPKGAKDFNELLGDATGFEMWPTHAEETAVLLYTSGTTGKPKGAELTHFQLYMNCDVGGRLFGVTPDDSVCAVLPLFHVFGLSSVLNTAIRNVCTISLVTRFDPDKVLEVLQRDKVTIFSGVPTMFMGLLHHPKLGEYDVSSLRVGNSGGASMPGEVIKQFEKKFGIRILEGYGLSETASAASFNRFEAAKVGSVGKPMWGVQMRILDEEGKPLPPGKDNVGEIVIRGHNVMRGYHNQKDATEEAFKGGWFHTGDMGYVDDEGFFFIVDRKKELIIRGGYNVYPREVEEVLYSHPAVQAAAVIGVPDDRLGEDVGAVVVLKDGESVSEQDLVAYVKERVASYKYPRKVRFVDSLPMGPTGKVLKKELSFSADAEQPVGAG